MDRVTQMMIIGGSAGSLDFLLKMLPHLGDNPNYPVVIVLHRKVSIDSILTELLATRTEIPVKEADEKEFFLPNIIYVAPADYHLLIEHDRTFSLDASEKINYSRPSIDVTFESAAAALGSNLVAILLSGANSDGVSGLQTIRTRGGIVVVQDPRSAIVPYMPQQALNAMAADVILNEENLECLRGF